jgi:hypothetical protein
LRPLYPPLGTRLWAINKDRDSRPWRVNYADIGDHMRNSTVYGVLHAKRPYLTAVKLCV